MQLKEIFEHPILRVYSNLAAFFESCGLAPKEPLNLKKEEVIKKATNDGYLLISCTDSPTHPIRRTGLGKRAYSTHVFLMNDHKEKSTKSADLVAMVRGIPYFARSVRKNNIEVIIITHKSLKPNFKKKIVEINANESETEEYGSVHVFNYPYELFTSKIIDHAGVSKHRIVKTEERPALEAALGLKFAQISSHDPMCVWIAAREGDIVEITRVTESTGFSISYRNVVV